MNSITSLFFSWLSFLPHMTYKNIIEIAIIAFVVYWVSIWFRNSKAWILLRGIFLIIGFTMFAYWMELDTILWILGKISVIAVTAILIIFQPELRKALEQLGSQVKFGRFFQFTADGTDEFTGQTIRELTRACFEMSRVKTGALIVLERQNSLKEIENTGIEVDGLVTSQLLINIFEHNTPLHDGAVVIRGNRVKAATCYLPLTESMELDKALGTRHRAAVGVSEVTDSVTIVVSEETGRVAAAIGGRLRHYGDEDALGFLLEEEMINRREKSARSGFLDRLKKNTVLRKTADADRKAGE